MTVKEETLVTEGMKEKDNLKRARVKMDEVREENERLKLTLSQMMKDYNSLKMQFNDIVQDDHPKKSTDSSPMDTAIISDDESEFVSLSLGRFSGDSKRDQAKKTDYVNENRNLEESGKLDGLDLGLDCKFHLGKSTHDHQMSKNLMGTESSSDDQSKEEENKKSPKNSRSGDEHEIMQHNPLKKPRVSVRAVCNTQTMHDGCQWRKYGQKIAKGNPCPRAYYRCTVSSSCPVRKQVQRCIDDMSILITTYEGTHNHPLPPSATTMASATSAAAAMLNCGSSSSASATSSSATLGFNFASSSSHNFPRATISSIQSHPTVILDLTAPNRSNPSSHNNNNNKLFSSSLFPTTNSSPTSLNFSSYPHQPFIYNSNNSIHGSSKEIVNDHKIAAATKAITRDPTFQSALAAAITSFVGTNVQGRNSGLNFDPSFSQTSTSNGNVGCATSLLNKFPQSVLNSQGNNLTNFAPLTLMSTSQSQAMVSLTDEAEQIK